MSRVELLPRHQEGLPEAWVQPAAAKKDTPTHDSRSMLYKYTQQILFTLYFTTASSSWHIASLLNQGFSFSFAGKMSSALFFPNMLSSCLFVILTQSYFHSHCIYTIIGHPELERTQEDHQPELEVMPYWRRYHPHFTGVFVRHRVHWVTQPCKEFSSVSPSLFNLLERSS